MEVALYRAAEKEAAVLRALMKDADLCIPFDCADRRSQFVVRGWFVFPKGSLTQPHDVKEPA